MMPIAETAMRIVDNAEQKRDREQMEATALQNCSALAAQEIVGWLGGTEWSAELANMQNVDFKQWEIRRISEIIYRHMRNGREL